jgi:crossover junction endodeoxyribonuclease RuvC
MSGDLILGIDPGLNGAVALVDLLSGELVEVGDVPVLQLNSKREFDVYRFAGLIDCYASRIEGGWIERVWSFPGEAGSLSFQFGAVYGALRGVVCANFIPLHDVPPATWKKAMGVKGDKDESRQAASLLWPRLSDQWPAKKHHGRAEAALIAAYGRRCHLKEHGQEAA